MKATQRMASVVLALLFGLAIVGWLLMRVGPHRGPASRARNHAIRVAPLKAGDASTSRPAKAIKHGVGRPTE